MFRKNIEKPKLFAIGETENEEIGDGVFEMRRRLLWLPVLAATAIFLPRNASAQTLQTTPKTGEINWEAFIKDCIPIAKELHKDSSVKGQDAYLFWLASMASRLAFDSIPKAAKLDSFGGFDPPVETGFAYGGVPFFIIEWRMSPNAYLPPHNHPNISVCTLCTDGEARIRNFEIEGNAPEFSSAQKFSVRETHNEILSAGRINTVSANRDNIHTFQAGKKGARGIDITTYHGKDAGFSFLDIRKKPNDAEKRIYEANWKQKKY